MKTARCTSVAWGLSCPSCDEPLTNADGSEMWTAEDVQDWLSVSIHYMHCPCGERIKFPSRLKALAAQS